ncbi:MAG: polyprenyl synthetase family protein [Planctomycetes bacterium]|nr:polyprenyl synthetase family protein [Planctomycetota bacterium]
MQLPAHTDICSSFKLIDEQLLQVRQLITKQLTGEGQLLNRLLEHVNIGEGKMIRPAIVLLSGLCAGKITDEHIRIAAIVELIHNATLLHDDVIDEGKKRRGSPTVNALHGNESAVLLGDFLLTRVFKTTAGLDAQITEEITATITKICEGEIRQIEQRKNWQLTESQYIDIITDKSASLFKTSCYLGALLADTNEAKSKALAEFGLNTGIAFQIADDLLDIIGDENKTGKTLRSDINKNKLTLAVIHLLKTADEKEKTAVIENLSTIETNQKTLTDMLQSCGSLEYAQNCAKQFAEKATAALADFEDGPAKKALIEIAVLAADRTT